LAVLCHPNTANYPALIVRKPPHKSRLTVA